MKPKHFSALLAALPHTNAVAARGTRRQDGPFLLLASAPGNQAIGGQYLIPLVVDSEIVGLHFRLSKPCKEDASFFFDYTVSDDGLPSPAGLLMHWPNWADPYTRRLWHTMAFEHIPAYNCAVPRFVKTPFFNLEYTHVSWENDTLLLATTTKRGQQPAGDDGKPAEPRGGWHACNLVYYKDRRLPVPYRGVAWLLGGSPPVADPSCTPIAIRRSDAFGSYQPPDTPVSPLGPGEGIGGGRGEDHEDRDDDGVDGGGDG